MLAVLKVADIPILASGAGHLEFPRGLLKVCFAEATADNVRVWYLEHGCSHPWTMTVVRVRVDEAFPSSKLERLTPLCRFEDYCFFVLS